MLSRKAFHYFKLHGFRFPLCPKPRYKLHVYIHVSLEKGDVVLLSPQANERWKLSSTGYTASQLRSLKMQRYVDLLFSRNLPHRTVNFFWQSEGFAVILDFRRAAYLWEPEYLSWVWSWECGLNCFGREEESRYFLSPPPAHLITINPMHNLHKISFTLWKESSAPLALRAQVLVLFALLSSSTPTPLQSLNTTAALSIRDEQQIIFHPMATS